MATKLPRTRQEMLSIHGVGERKADAYGEAFMAAVRQFVAEHGESGDPNRAVAIKPDEDRPRRSEESAREFASGRAMDEIARRWSIKRDTVLNHLAEYVRDGGRLDPAQLLGESRLSEEDRRRVTEALPKADHRVGLVFEMLGGAIPHAEIRLISLVILCDER